MQQRIVLDILLYKIRRGRACAQNYCPTMKGRLGSTSLFVQLTTYLLYRRCNIIPGMSTNLLLYRPLLWRIHVDVLRRDAGKVRLMHVLYEEMYRSFQIKIIWDGPCSLHFS